MLCTQIHATCSFFFPLDVVDGVIQKNPVDHYHFVHLSPTTEGMHSCPHPLEQHFSFLGQSLSLEQDLTQFLKSKHLRGHTPGFSEGKRKHYRQRAPTVERGKYDLTLWHILETGGTQTSPPRKWQHMWSLGQSSHPLRDRARLRCFGHSLEKEAVKPKRIQISCGKWGRSCNAVWLPNWLLNEKKSMHVLHLKRLTPLYHRVDFYTAGPWWYPKIYEGS